ncbi:NADH-quinone oxidoreductase subunit NuoI [Geomesophilobacter sediminis]|uniref:NADH-quinone oxidoreductase subunit I n=1 Tax=Geomesophilobacter sediminis TaxID=2798584 RepID=A0A8J7LVM1_9BACT|nr:NADH-quinone oxidoreductase subunit NuoI [Geomesophilobacter sediminis]MBJ6725684.1 NADH-quinone oxidoreductase subunit NuoI [Geomesophilobacter sediminis]
MSLLSDIQAILTGLAITFSHIFRKPVTVSYPEEKRPMPERFRGSIVLTRDPDGEERCVACYLCSGACPVDCISMAAAETPNGRRYAAWFRINFARCILCGLCAEACPTLAIQMSSEMFPCKRDVMNMLYEKEDLLIDGTGKDPNYNFYRHAGIGVVTPRGANPDEHPPVDVRTILP